MEGKKNTVRPNGTDSARVIQVIETKSNRGKAGSIRGYFKCTDYGFINGIIRKQDAKNEHRKNIDN